MFQQGNLQVGNYLRVNNTAKVPPVPFALRIFKGSKTFRLPRHFVEFLLHHEVARTYIDWSRKQISPEEQIIPTLARISSMKWTNGSWLVEQDYMPLSDRLQLALWRHEKPPKAPCHGTWRNNVCVFSIRWVGPFLCKTQHNAQHKVTTASDVLVSSGTLPSYWMKDRTL